MCCHPPSQEGKGLIRVNGVPIHLVQPEILRYKVYEPVLIAGADVSSVGIQCLRRQSLMLLCRTGFL